jgi:hypothetical protein
MQKALCGSIVLKAEGVEKFQFDKKPGHEARVFGPEIAFWR